MGSVGWGQRSACMPLSERPRQEWDCMLALNLTAVYVGCVTAAHDMDTGSIVLCLSSQRYGRLGHGPGPQGGRRRHAQQASEPVSQGAELGAGNHRTSGCAGCSDSHATRWFRRCVRLGDWPPTGQRRRGLRPADRLLRDAPD